MPTVRCPGCDEAMDIEADWYGRRVACPTCDRQFTARRPGAPDDGDDEPRPRRRSSRYDDDDFDDRPKRRERRERKPEGMSRGGKQLMTLGIVGGVLLLLCGGCGVWGWVAFTGPVDYSAKWVTQPLPDNSYSMDFPRSPKVVSKPNPFEGDGGTAYMLEEDGLTDAAFLFRSIDPAVTSPNLFDELYQEILDGARKEVKAKASPHRTIDWNGFKGRETELSVGPARVTCRMIDVSTPTRPRYLVVMAGGRNVSEADKKKFLDSLKANTK